MIDVQLCQGICCYNKHNRICDYVFLNTVDYSLKFCNNSINNKKKQDKTILE